MNFLFLFTSATVIAVIITPIIRLLALRFGIVSVPKGLSKEIHKNPVPLLGGIGVFVSFGIVTISYILYGHPNLQIIPLKFFLAMLGGGAVLMLGGALDDQYELPPKILWLFPAAASLIVVLSGIGVGIKYISNPFGSPISLNYFLFGIPFSGIFMWIWMMGMIFTTKFLDGLDGLCAGISLIGGLTLFALSLTSKVNQPITASIAIIFSGALFGYMFYAWHPASIFLGEGGSTFVGFVLAVLSIISGGKIATALLVMGIPILDIAWVIVRRLWYKRSPFQGDRGHLHHRLLDLGLSQRQTVAFLYFFSIIFGFTAVFLQSFGKLIALIILSSVMLVLALSAVMIYKKREAMNKITG